MTTSNNVCYDIPSHESFAYSTGASLRSLLSPGIPDSIPNIREHGDRGEGEQNKDRLSGRAYVKMDKQSKNGENDTETDHDLPWFYNHGKMTGRWVPKST